jgi:sulfate transport system ATP-binding protein
VSVTVQGLTKRFVAGGSPAIGDVSFDAPTGGITALIGPSGAGKSTVLRIVAGLEQADEGSVRIGGADCTRTRPQDRGVGLVFQSYALFQNMSVRDNVGFGLSVRGRNKAEVRKRADELLELVELGGYGDRFPSQLSGGQRQRVAFARALAIEPKVLLLDEPFGALDARVRSGLREWLHELHHRTKVTTLLVTHDREEALEISEHVVILLDGRVAQAGSPASVYDHPASPAVAELFGANVLRGEALRHVHPHEVTLARTSSSGSDHEDVRTGTIQRMRPVGARVKITLLMPEGDRVTVDMAREEVEELAVVEGDRVLVDVRAARMFLGDYAI